MATTRRRPGPGEATGERDRPAEVPPPAAGPDAPTDRLAFRATVSSAPYDALTSLPVDVVLDSVRSLYNVGSFFRTCDAVGTGCLWLCGISGRPDNPRLAKTALGAEQTQRWTGADDAAAVVESLRSAGFEIAAVETHRHAVDLFDWQPRFPVAVVFGHETEGVSQAVRDRADVFVRLPMLGSKHSVNVATAGGVVLYELLRKYRVTRSRST